MSGQTFHVAESLIGSHAVSPPLQTPHWNLSRLLVGNHMDPDNPLEGRVHQLPRQGGMEPVTQTGSVCH